MKIILSLAIIFLSAILLLTCTPEKKTLSKADLAQLKEELRQLEATHMDTVAKYGFIRSLLHFTGEEFALIGRNDEPILTLDSIKLLVSRMPSEATPDPYTLTWKPDFIDVSASGDMGYTYGYYQITPQDTSQQPIRGSYLTIWKKDGDGKWRLVID